MGVKQMMRRRPYVPKRDAEIMDVVVVHRSAYINLVPPGDWPDGELAWYVAGVEGPLTTDGTGMGERGEHISVVVRGGRVIREGNSDPFGS